MNSEPSYLDEDDLRLVFHVVRSQSNVFQFGQAAVSCRDHMLGAHQRSSALRRYSIPVFDQINLND